MKLIIVSLFASLLMSHALSAQQQSKDTPPPQYISASGSTVTFQNAPGSGTITLEYLFTTGISAPTITVQGCGSGGTCTTLTAITGTNPYTTATNAMVTFAGGYFQYKVTATYTGTGTITVSFVGIQAKTGSSGGGGPTTFDQVGSGTNTSHGLVVGAGSVLTTAGNGIINANELNGVLLSGLATGPLCNTTGTGVPVKCTGADVTALGVDGYQAVPLGQVIIGDGASILRGYQLGTAQLATGGLTGNPIWQLGTSPWGTGSTYYNDAVDGSTTTQMLSRYTTGNNTYGVTVPAPHTLCLAATSAGVRGLFFISLDAAFNDTNNSVNQATSISNLTSLVSAAQTDGCRVVILLSTVIDNPINPMTGGIAGRNQLLAVHEAARNGTLGTLGTNLLVVNSDNWLPNPSDTTVLQDGVHPTIAGDRLIGQNIVAAMLGRGDTMTSWAGYINTPINVPAITVNAGTLASGAAPPVDISINAAPGALAMRMKNTNNADYTQAQLVGTGITVAWGIGNAGESAIGVANKYYLFNATGANLMYTIDGAGNAKYFGQVGATQLITSGSAPNVITSGAVVASATTIAITSPIFHISGTSAIATMTFPTGFDATHGGCVDVIADGAWQTTTAGNFFAVMTAVPGTPYRFCATNTADKWFGK